MSLEVSGLTVQHHEFKLQGVSFHISKGGVLSMMGRSGIGKTTLVEALCGLRRSSTGYIKLGGRDVQELRPSERGIGLVPQDGALFAHMTVQQHLEFAPRIHGWSRGRQSDRVEEIASLLGLSSLLNRLPAELSGGEQKRVAIGRAITVSPVLLCLDEAFSGLDDHSVDQIVASLIPILKQEAITTLHITHSRKEAELLGGETLLIESLIS